MSIRLRKSVLLGALGLCSPCLGSLWVGTTSSWETTTNWSPNVVPGERGNSASLNTDLVEMKDSLFSPIVSSSTRVAFGGFDLNSTISSHRGFGISTGTAILNGATINGIANTILSNRGSGTAELRTSAPTIQLGNLNNVVQVGLSRRISIVDFSSSATITQRNTGSGITLQGSTVPGSVGQFVTGSCSFTGPVRISDAAMWVVKAPANGGSPSSLGASGNQAGNLVLDGGFLQIAGSGTTDRLFTITPKGGVVMDSPTFVGNFTNTGPIAFEGEGNRTLDLGSFASGLTFSPTIGDPASGVTSLEIQGTSAVTLTSSHSYSGNTIITDFGKIQLKNTADFGNSHLISLLGTNSRIGSSGLTGGKNFDGNASHIALASGQTVEGVGTIDSFLNVRSGSTLSPGLGLGILNAGAVDLSGSDSRLSIDLDLGSIVKADRLNLSSLSINGSILSLTINNLPSLPITSPKTLLIGVNSGSQTITGTFGSIELPAGYGAIVNYSFTGTDSIGRVGNGNDLAITIIPEPGLMMSMGLFAAAALLFGRRL